MRHVKHTAPLNAPTIIGRTRTGAPVWSLAGGAEDGDDEESDDEASEDEDEGEEDEGEESEDEDEDDKPLGPKGEKALARLKAERRDLKRQLREARAEAGKKKDQPGDDDLDPEEMRKQIRGEVESENARDRALDKLEVKAAKTFADPEDARALLADRADDFLDEKGKPDVEAIVEALDELLEKKPHLAAQRGKWKGNGDGGARRSKPTRAKNIGEAVGRHYESS